MEEQTTDGIRQGRRFRHARHLSEHVNPGTGKRDTVLCKVTKVTLLEVFYRSGINADGTGGSKWRIGREAFLNGTLLRWADEGEA